MLKKHHYWLGLFWLAVLFVLPAPLIVTVALGLKGTLNQSAIFGSQVGTIAYVWMLLVTVLSEKPRWLDRLIGLPEVYFLHGMVGIMAIVLAFWHSLLLQSDGLILLTGNTALYLFIAVALYSVFFLSSWLTSRSRSLNNLKNVLEKVFRYEVSIWLHRLNIVGILLVFGHVILISYITAIPTYMFWFYLYSGVTAIVYISLHLIKPLAFMSGTLISSQKLADNVTELIVQLKHKGDFRAGDFVFISFPDDADLKETHPFSILQYDRQKKTLTFAIRNYSDFTLKLDQVKLNSRVRIDGGYGRLYESMEEHMDQPLVMIGSGIGSVPLIALVLHFVNKKEIIFVRVAHEAQDLIYESFLKKLGHDYPNFTYYSQVGRLSEEQIQQLINKNSYYLVGGSNLMMRGTMGLLRKNGVKSGNIYGEKFSF